MSQPSPTLKRFEVKEPEMTILSDHPVDDVLKDGQEDAALPDNLELAARLSAIFDILRHKDTRCPLTVAIYGDWGTGKTSAMQWLSGKLTEWNQQNAQHEHGHPNVHPVWFEPWKYHTKEDVWRGIISEVILSLFTVNFHDPQHLVTGMKEAAKRFGAFLGRSFLHALKSVKFRVGDPKAAQLEVSGEAFQDIYEEWEKVAHPQKPYLNQFETTLKEWMERYLPRRTETVGGIDTPRQDRIVLFIDDLDRCLPDVTLEVLEAIKLYLSIPSLIFVCGLDRSVVDAVVRKRYTDHGLTDEHKSEHYLNKIFQVEVDISPSQTQVTSYLHTILSSINQLTGSYLDKMLGDQQEGGPLPTTARERLHSGLSHLARHNPREIKRLLNSALLRGRMAADNIRLHSAAQAFDDNKGLKPALSSLALPAEDKPRPLLFAQGVALYLLQRQLESTRCLGRETASHLFRSTSFIAWLADFSAFLCLQPDFAVPERQTEAKPEREADPDQAGKARPGLKIPPTDPIRAEYDQLLRDKRLRLEDGKSIPTAYLEHDIVFSLLRIPFSIHVAQSAPAPTAASSSPQSRQGIDLLAPVLRECIQEELRKIEDTPLTTDDLAQVSKLNLSREPIQNADLEGIHLLTRLTKLYMMDTQVTDEGLVILQKLSQLTELYLNGTQISDAGLAYLQKLKQLTKLNLSATHVSDAGLVHLQKLTQLTKLALYGTNVSDAGLTHLQKLTQLTYLDLNGTHVSDAGLVHLQKLTQLTDLLLSGTQVSDAGRKRLQAALPECHIGG